MMKFKVGDRVRVLVDWSTRVRKGEIDTVARLDADGDIWTERGGCFSSEVGRHCLYAETVATNRPHKPEAEYTGGSVNYYRVKIDRPTSPDVAPYEAECNDIIEALGMNYAEGNAFKAIWRACAARQGKAKRGYDDGLYDAEKVVFFGQRMVAQAKGEK